MKIIPFDARLLCGLLLGLSRLAYGAVVPDRVDTVDITVNGKGCPQGSVGRNISQDRQSFVLNFRDFIAELSPQQEKTFGS